MIAKKRPGAHLALLLLAQRWPLDVLVLTCAGKASIDLPAEPKPLSGEEAVDDFGGIHLGEGPGDDRIEFPVRACAHLASIRV